MSFPPCNRCGKDAHVFSCEAARFNSTDDDLALAKHLHENYERFAIIAGWNTQAACKVAWDALPDANKKVMLMIAECAREYVRQQEAKHDDR